MPGTRAPRLLTLAASHYCEKARWGLERAGIAYEEECHAPGIHRLIVARHRAGVKVPILLTDEVRIGGSSAILQHVDALLAPELRLYPEDPARRAEVLELERRFDDVLGPATRVLAYWYVLPHPEMLYSLMDHELPRAEHFILRRLTPVVNFIVKTALGVNESGRAKAEATVDEIFTEVEERLADGRAHLTGDDFTAADLAFATLSTPMVWPQGYRVQMPVLESAPADMRETVLRNRERPAGLHALRVFEQERHRVPEKVPA